MVIVPVRSDDQSDSVQRTVLKATQILRRDRFSKAMGDTRIYYTPFIITEVENYALSPSWTND